MHVVTLSTQASDSFELYRLHAGPAGLSGHSITLNGHVLALGPGGSLPRMPAVSASGALTLAPLDIAFVVFRDMHCPVANK